MTPIEKSVDVEEDRGAYVGARVHLIVHFRSLYTIRCYTVQFEKRELCP